MKGFVEGWIMKAITANELKTRGVASIDAALKDQDEAIISVRGKDCYVVMDVETYNRLRVCELEAALYQTRQEIADGKAVEESVEEHIERIKKL
jgi:PHD/YefM family antitoxin component YafN of YafNO toxin-antitoxin module